MKNKGRTGMVADILLEQGAIPVGELQTALTAYESLDNAVRHSIAFDVFLEREGIASETVILESLGRHLDIPVVDVRNSTSPESGKLLPAGFAVKNRVLPLEAGENELILAVNDPFETRVLDDARLLTGLNVRPVLARRKEIYNALRKLYGIGADTVEHLVGTDPSEEEMPSRQETVSDREQANRDPSIITYVDDVIADAVDNRATDIHVEPLQNRLRIRYRIDGLLQETTMPPGTKQLQLAIISRIKLLAGMDIAESRRPQDGRIQMKKAGEDLDLRVSTAPTAFGESVSVRILRKNRDMIDMEHLGASPVTLCAVDSLLSERNGLVLVTGPTGCGKTTTLYSILSRLNTDNVRIVTVEDPVEYQIEGINQIQVNAGIGVTFASVLRSILRQDPDIIMVGEIRDAETADTAIRGSLTGHMVFSTLHTNDAAGAITRLLDMNVEPYLVASSVTGVIAQRLVRRACAACSAPDDSAGPHVTASDTEPKVTRGFVRGTGCPECRQTGYKGRAGIFEVLRMDDDMRQLVLERAHPAEIKRLAMSRGMVSLRQSALKAAEHSVTTREEAIRVTRADE